MSIIKKMRKQKAVWWKRLAPDQFGQFSFATPVEISCRWDDEVVEFRDAKGQLEVSRSIVYVDRAIFAGDRLMFGPLDQTTPASPVSVSTALEVKRLMTTPNFKATEFLYSAYL